MSPRHSINTEARLLLILESSLLAIFWVQGSIYPKWKQFKSSANWIDIYLKSKKMLGERLHANKIRSNDHSRRIMGAVMVRRSLAWNTKPVKSTDTKLLPESRHEGVILPCGSSHSLYLFMNCLSLSLDWAPMGFVKTLKVPASHKSSSCNQNEPVTPPYEEPSDKKKTDLGVVIGKDPRKHRVLHEVVVRSSGKRVQMHQILEIAYFAPLKKKWIREEVTFNAMGNSTAKVKVLLGDHRIPISAHETSTSAKSVASCQNISRNIFFYRKVSPIRHTIYTQICPLTKRDASVKKKWKK